MPRAANNNGRAYEYAWINTLYGELAPVRKTDIVKNSSWDANEKAWKAIEPTTRATFATSAGAAVGTILKLEPRMEEKDNDTLYLEFQRDEAGERGDVRDIVIRRRNIQWEVGLSVKHNHTAVKHSRLSHVLDFGQEWYGIPCSQQYWADVTPIFDLLRQENAKSTPWNALAGKEDRVYVPLLQAFLDEVGRAAQQDPKVTPRMLEYLVGVKDFYKIISRDKKRVTEIHTFQLHGSLNKAAKDKESGIKVPTVKAPTEILKCRFKKNSKTTVEIYMDNGWAFSFRIHSADRQVQPSLKFDVQFISTPATVLGLICAWGK